MTEICDRCDNEFIPNRERTKKWQPVFNYCSHKCRIKMYQDIRRAKEIKRGNWHNKRISLIERLGFKVRVTKV